MKFIFTFRSNHPLSGCFCTITAANQHEAIATATRNFGFYWQNCTRVLDTTRLTEITLEGEPLELPKT